MKLDVLTVRQILSFSLGLSCGLGSKYYNVHVVPEAVENFFYKYFSQSGRHLVEEEKRSG